MNQNQLCREVARATGETVERIRQMGFSLIAIDTPAPIITEQALRSFRRGHRSNFFRKSRQLHRRAS